MLGLGVIGIVVLIIVILVLISCIRIVRQAQALVIERLGAQGFILNCRSLTVWQGRLI